MTHSSTYSILDLPEQTGKTPQDLCAILASRICHDLVSPLGAIGNGLELMQLAQVVDGPELSLVAQSTCSANARLRFYRIAFGIVTADQAISQSEILSILNALQPHQKHRITWNCATNLTRQQAKLLFLLLMCLESTIPWGGEIEICTCKSGLQLVARAERYRMEHALWQAVQHGGRLEDVSPAKIHFALAGAEIRAQNCRVTLSDHVSCYVIDVALQ